MKTVIVTGGIGSGKSEVCAHLARRGVPVYDSDAQAKALYGSDEALVQAVEQLSGLRLRTADGKFRPRTLSRWVFADAGRLQALEAVVHPAVRADFLHWRTLQTAPYGVLESAVILSKPLFDGLADRIVLVDAPVEVRLQRAMHRDAAAREDILARMARQSYEGFRFDAVLYNDGSLEALFRKTDALFETLF